MKDGLSSLLIGILLVVAAVGVFFYFNISLRQGEKAGPRIQIVANLQKIGLALRDLSQRTAERTADETLSQLIPQYVAKTNLTIFYARHSTQNTPRSPA
jgi:lambda repressor-like predicted transcriptional regulator